MSHSFVGTTLALQHYYDIIAVSRKLPLMTIYQSHEQPFGQRMAVWMTTYSDEIQVSETTQKRLDETLLKNRAINDTHVLRVLDYGTTEGCSFVVTDAIDDMISLQAWLRTHGTLAIWQILRLLEQLVGIIHCAHRSGFKNLCLTCDNIFIKDTERFEIVTGPLGIGLHRNEILNMKDVPVTAALMRHIPPWEYTTQTYSKNSDTSKTEQTPSESSKPQKDEKLSAKENTENHQPNIENTNAQISNAENTENTPDNPESPSSSHHANDTPGHDSIQDLDIHSAQIETITETPDTPDALCADTYNLATILYEALCGQHPYFNEERDLCDAAFAMIQATPLDLSKRIEIPENMNDVVMNLLKTPKSDALEDFLSTFAAICPAEEKEKARQADKIWLTPAKHDSTTRKKRRQKVKLKHPFAYMSIALAILLGLAIAVTWHIASYQSPVDLFALPEIVPAVPDGIDVVLAPRSIPPETSVFLTSHADGTLIKVGTLPFIYRQQAPDTHLNFVIADEYGHTMQVPVTVKGENGLMLVPIDLNW
ncbi:MAG: hypothetical protein J6S69_03485 [Proteobacteria bacterium]|nr:hypothetical protein [Pseudomonadota bacterium]